MCQLRRNRPDFDFNMRSIFGVPSRRPDTSSAPNHAVPDRRSRPEPRVIEIELPDVFPRKTKGGTTRDSPRAGTQPFSGMHRPPEHRISDLLGHFPNRSLRPAAQASAGRNRRRFGAPESESNVAQIRIGVEEPSKTDSEREVVGRSRLLRQLQQRLVIEAVDGTRGFPHRNGIDDPDSGLPPPQRPDVEDVWSLFGGHLQRKPLVPQCLNHRTPEAVILHERVAETDHEHGGADFPRNQGSTRTT